nr:hypothetical protein [bacterium]
MAELLKEAIADAKAVREVALQNAKMALEEAFDSKIKSMLSAKLAEEIEEDVELEEEYVEEEVDTTDEAVEATDEGMSYDEDDKVKEVDDSIEEDIDEEINLDELMAELEEMSYDEDEKSEGMKYDEDEKANEGKKDDEQMEEGVLDEDVKDAVEMIKQAAKKAGKNVVDYLVGNKHIDSGITTTTREGVDETNESFDIDSLVAEIESEMEEGKKKDDDDMKEGKKKDDDDMKEGKKKAEKDLEEALATVASLKETISEMNLLNSKLLYCNKLFKANALTEAQKVKVVDALDKSTTTGEAKLVFETLQESFNFTGVEKRAIKEGLGRASKVAGTAPKNVITESVDETVSRFQKLANINK